MTTCRSPAGRDPKWLAGVVGWTIGLAEPSFLDLTGQFGLLYLLCKIVEIWIKKTFRKGTPLQGGVPPLIATPLISTNPKNILDFLGAALG